MAEPPRVNEAKHAQLFGSLFQSTGIFPGDASLVEVHATHVFDAVAACHAEWAEGFSAPLQLRANILADVLLHLVILCVYLHWPLQDDLQIYFLARDFTMEELAYIAADDPYALAKKGQVFRHLTIPETVFQVPETSYRMQNIPPKWCKIKTLVRKAAAAHIPPRFSLPTAYDLHGEEYVWKVVELQSILVLVTPHLWIQPIVRSS
jgi:hypothetical protein